MRNRFDRQMLRLHTLLIEMGALCESSIASAMKALLEHDGANAKRVLEMEEEIDNREREIENLCLKLLLQQQPVAGDLRQVSSALKMITDLERIGDQAADIADIARLGNVRADDDTACIKEMSIAAIGMLTDAIDAYVGRDTALAHAVIAADDRVDDFFNRSKRELTLLLRQAPEQAECAVDLLMVSKYLERIGDHAVNIAEWVVFAVTGRHPAHEQAGGESP